MEKNKLEFDKSIFDEIVEITNSDLTNENANMNSATPSGQMMKFASQLAKEYALNYLLTNEERKLHQEGWIHIHDLDYYATKSTTCLQYDLIELFNNGFKTTKGFIRQPRSITSYANLALLVFQGNQNEQHGGQAIPAFDFMMAPGVVASAVKILQTQNCGEKVPTFTSLEDIEIYCKENKLNYDTLISRLEEECFQAMESFIYNLNTIHSRGGNQVVFSSINYGTDTSIAGRMIIKNILKATQKGLGSGETPIFPIQIFKVKEQINYFETDPNYDLFLLAIETNAARLFPNFMFLDTEFNKHELWNINDPKRYIYEGATMGCRTRVFENVNGIKTSLGRGNLSFTSINLVRLALISNDIPSFYQQVEKMADKVAQQLLNRYEYQKTAIAKQFPFMALNNLWKGMGELNQNDFVGETLNQGSLSIGFIGGHEAMCVLNQKGHGTNQTSHDILLKTITIIRRVADKYKNKYHLNYSCLATPAESLSGRFVKLDAKKFGIIENVTDKDYYTNSFHVWVKDKISPLTKIKLEAPFHNLCNGGHITYVEFDGCAKNNLAALIQVVKYMKEQQIGYGSINHPLDQCKDCYQSGYFEDKCLFCGGENITKIRRITGYLVGDMSSWNAAKVSEEKDRIKHIKYVEDFNEN